MFSLFLLLLSYYEFTVIEQEQQKQQNFQIFDVLHTYVPYMHTQKSY